MNNAYETWLHSQHQMMKRETAKEVRSAKIMITKAFNRLERKHVRINPRRFVPGIAEATAAFKKLGVALSKMKGYAEGLSEVNEYDQS